MTRIVVVGGGQAAASLIAKLRAEGFGGAITLICEEPVPPYQRPPLSKAYLLGDMARERLYFRPEAWYAEQDVTLILGTRAATIDRAARTVTAGGATHPFDALVLTTGSVPHRLPEAIGGALDGVFTVRTLADVDAMADAFAPGHRLVVVGGGYIGLEAAAVGAKKGLSVSVVEMADRILRRVAAPETSDYFRALHARHGVDVIENTGVARLTGTARVDGAELSDGRRIEADFVVVGVGIAPAIALADAAGLTCENGIATDAFGRTSDPAIWAAGDCASFPFRGTRIRLESVQNAIDQAECVAANLLGRETPYDPQPWFWSDQYDVKLQIAGLNTGFDRLVVRQGEREEARSHWYYRGADLISVDAMNDPRAYMVGKRLIEAAKSPAPEVIADPATDLKRLLRA